MTVPIDSRAKAVWLLDEQQDGVHPKDSAGNLAELEVDSTLTRPAVVPWTNGFAREFTAAPATGFEVVDTNDDLLLARNLTILAIMTFDNAAQDAAGTPGTVITRGRDSELTPFGLRLTVTNAATDEVRIQLFWENTAGTQVVDAGVLVTWPDDEEFIIAAIREQEGSDFVVRYVVNADWANGSTHPLDIGATSASSVFVGAEPTGASAYQNHLAGDIAFLEVLDEAVAVEEVIDVWRLFFEDVPNGITAIRGLLPPGPYSRDPNSFIQREVAMEGAALGTVKNTARRRRSFPDEASGDRLAEWERITGRKRTADQSIDQRQQCILDYLSTLPGLETADLKQELLKALGYTAIASIDILTYDVDNTEDFASASTPGADDAIISEGNGTFTVAAGVLEVDATAVSLRFDPLDNANAPYHI